ncbi:MAG: 3-hydroxyacyl-CoA dehydrogenase [Desulfobacteraceae bacterium]|jgi:3-hydroxyacyl-CoA dehydrogenase|nr:3-hydroxyacyl-CoA dehydrogenase [Desulfobacteraceae bacterium]
MKEIQTVGVVGFGVMGAAIGLNAAASGYRVIYKELNEDLVASMYDKWVLQALRKRVDKGKMSPEEMDTVSGRITGTTRYEDLAACELVIEAAVEKMDLKIQIFQDLSSACPQDTLLVSNTSTFLIEKLMEKAANPSRTAGLHYFFPANVNKLVEVIRQRETGDDTYEALMEFSKRNGKVPITVRDFPGFAINPIFISSYLVLDSFLDAGVSVATLEDISQKTLGVRFGIMWVQNGSGLGTCYHAGESMVEYLSDTDIGYPSVPEALKAQFESGKPWNLEDEAVSTDETVRKPVRERLLGGIFAIASHLVEKEVVSIQDLELGVRTSLAWPKGPFALMNELGMNEALRLVKVSVEAGDFKMPRKFGDEDLSPWPL